MEDCENNVHLPMELVAMLRGEVPYPEEAKDLAELCIYAYQDGKNGLHYDPVEEDPGFPTWTAKCLDMLLRAAHKQGRVDAGLEKHTSRTAPLYTAYVDLEAK